MNVAPCSYPHIYFLKNPLNRGVHAEKIYTPLCRRSAGGEIIKGHIVFLTSIKEVSNFSTFFKIGRQ